MLTHDSMSHAYRADNRNPTAVVLCCGLCQDQAAGYGSYCSSPLAEITVRCSPAEFSLFCPDTTQPNVCKCCISWALAAWYSGVVIVFSCCCIHAGSNKMLRHHGRRVTRAKTADSSIA